MKLALTTQGAESLRKLAKQLPTTLNEIGTATIKLFELYESLSDNLGEHSDLFKDLLLYVKQAIALASDAINELPPKMEITAQAIDAYVNLIPGKGNSVSSIGYRSTSAMNRKK